MIIDAQETMTTLDALCRAYRENLQQLEEVRACLHMQCAKLMELGETKAFYAIAETTCSSFQDMEAAMQKLQSALASATMLAQDYRTLWDDTQQHLDSFR